MASVVLLAAGRGSARPRVLRPRLLALPFLLQVPFALSAAPVRAFRSAPECFVSVSAGSSRVGGGGVGLSTGQRFPRMKRLHGGCRKHLHGRSFTARSSEQTEMSDLTAEERDTAMKIQALIQNAIAIGAPKFNEGDIAGCVEVYGETCQRIQGMAKGLRFFSVLYQIDKLVMAIKRESPGSDLSQRAWGMRRTLDNVYNSLEKMKSPSLKIGPEGIVTLFNFKTEAGSLPWYPLNDVVMGGASSGALEFDEEKGRTVFEGSLSSAGNGGFASVRSGTIKSDLSSFSGVEVEGSGDGRTYKICVIGPARQMGIVYQADFTLPVDSSTAKIRIPFSSFNPTSFGRLVPEMPKLTAGSISQFGLMISKLTDRGDTNPNFKFGNFRLELERLNLYV